MAILRLEESLPSPGSSSQGVSELVSDLTPVLLQIPDTAVSIVGGTGLGVPGEGCSQKILSQVECPLHVPSPALQILNENFTLQKTFPGFPFQPGSLTYGLCVIW